MLTSVCKEMHAHMHMQMVLECRAKMQTHAFTNVCVFREIYTHANQHKFRLYLIHGWVLHSIVFACCMLVQIYIHVHVYEIIWGTHELVHKTCIGANM